MARVATLPDDAPDWARQKLSEGKPLHRFEPDSGLDEKVRHIADWIKAAVINQADWIGKVDAGKPIRFKKLNTLDLASEEADTVLIFSIFKLIYIFLLRVMHKMLFRALSPHHQKSYNFIGKNHVTLKKIPSTAVPWV